MALAEEQRSVLRVGALALDRRRVQVTLGGVALALTRSEFVLLAALMERPGEAVSRRVLAEAVWGERAVHEGGPPLAQPLFQLRAKLRRAAAAARTAAPAIAFLRDAGYRLAA